MNLYGIQIWDIETAAVIFEAVVLPSGNGPPPYIEYPEVGQRRQRYVRLYLGPHEAIYHGPLQVEVSA